MAPKVKSMREKKQLMNGWASGIDWDRFMQTHGIRLGTAEDAAKYERKIRERDRRTAEIMQQLAKDLAGAFAS